MKQSLEVEFETAILENGVEIKRNPARKNLLLDSGLDLPASHTFNECFNYCVLGDGTTPTKRDSGTTTVSITSETATSSAAIFEAADVGRLLKLDSGQEVYIDGFTDTQNVSVTGANDDTSSEFTIWYVNETGHANEIVRTNNLSGETGAQSVSFSDPVITMQKTFIFPEETSGVTYKEIGWSPNGSSGGNLFGRQLIDGGNGDSLLSGQRYKVVVKLKISLSPTAQISVSDVGENGFSTAGTAIITSLGEAFDYPTNQFESGTAFEPSSSKKLKFADDPIATFPTTPETNGNGWGGFNSSLFNAEMNFDAYVSGSGKLSFHYTASPDSLNVDWYGVGFGARGDIKANFFVEFDAAQTKVSDNEIKVTFELSWDRTLTN